MLQVLARRGVDPMLPRAAFAWTPDARCSTVLGLEWREDGQSGATLYLEEIGRFWTREQADALLARLGGLAGQPAATWGDDPGDDYIVALDLHGGRATALKTYRLVQDRAAALAAAPDLGTPWADAIAGGQPTDGFILQRRHRDGAPAPLKLYKTWSYLDGQGPGPAQELTALVAPLDPDDRLGQLTAALRTAETGTAEIGTAGIGAPPLTSVGLRLAPGDPRPRVATAYWCLARGPDGGDLP